MGLGRTGTLPAPDHRRGLAPIPITLERTHQGSSGSPGPRPNLVPGLALPDARPGRSPLGTDPDTIYPMVLSRLEADALIRRVNGPDGQNRHAWLLEPEQVTVSTATIGLVCGRCGRRETALAENAGSCARIPCTRMGCDGHLEATKPPEAAGPPPIPRLGSEP